MTDYSALIKAILDTTEVDKKIAGLQGRTISLNLNLTNKNFNLNSFLKNLQSQMKSGGQAAAKELSNAVNNINVSNGMGQIANMQRVLKTLHFDRSSIDTITEGLDRFNLKIREVNTNLDGDIINVTVRGVDELGRAITLVESYDPISGRITRANEDISHSFEKMAKAEEEANRVRIRSQTLSSRMDSWLNQNAKAAKVYGSTIEKLKEDLSLDNIDKQKYSEISLEFQRIQAEAKTAGLTVNVFGQELKNAVKQMLGLGSSYMILQKILDIFKKMYNELYEIDTAMTNLYKVTDETATKYSSFLKNAKTDAQELGRTVSSIVEQTATWAKLGYSLDEAADLAKISSVYANVGEVDNETAVSDMVTALKAFNIEAKNAISVIDPLNELGNTFATSAADLGSGLAKSASALNLAGASMNETLAMITGGAEITQNATEFGNFLKVASMRIRGMKGELEALGEEVDDKIESISKVQTQILNITKGKVNIFDDEGEFRNIYNIMQDISEVFRELKSTEKAELSEILFGKVRGNQGAALISAFQSGQVQKALETAENSAGSAMKEQEKWMESFEAKTASVKAAWQGLSESFLNSDFLKDAMDDGTGFLNVLTKMVDTFGSLPTLIFATTTALSVFKKDFGRDKKLSLLC